MVRVFVGEPQLGITSICTELVSTPSAFAVLFIRALVAVAVGVNVRVNVGVLVGVGERYGVFVRVGVADTTGVFVGD